MKKSSFSTLDTLFDKILIEHLFRNILYLKQKKQNFLFVLILWNTMLPLRENDVAITCISP